MDENSSRIRSKRASNSAYAVVAVDSIKRMIECEAQKVSFWSKVTSRLQTTEKK